MRRLQERMKEACEQRMETTFAVSKVSYLELDQKHRQSDSNYYQERKGQLKLGKFKLSLFFALQLYNEKFSKKIDDVTRQMTTQVTNEQLDEWKVHYILVHFFCHLHFLRGLYVCIVFSSRLINKMLIGTSPPRLEDLTP